MDLPNLLQELSIRFQLPDLKLNEEGVLRLVFDKKLVVDIESPSNGEQFHLVGVVGLLPAVDRDLMCIKLLEANPFGRGTGGSVLGVEPATSEVLLTRSFPKSGVDFDEFAGDFEEFLNALEYWQTQFTSPKALEEKPSGPTPESHEETHFSDLRA